MKLSFASAITAMILAASTAVSAGEPFNGLIFDALGKPIKGAKIYITDSRRYATSDKEGRFGLTDVFPGDTLRVKVKKQLYNIPVDGRKAVRIYVGDELTGARSEADNALVDYGYGFVKKREYTGVSDGISGEELARTGQTSIIQALAGKVAGLDVHGNSVTIRGKKSFMLSNEPLYVVDGVIVNSFDGINIRDVDYVQVLKDASIYGSRGANGAIIVRTKGAR